MRTWWSAIELGTSSYEEIKHRKVIAQGWRDLGHLNSLIPLVGLDWEGFVRVIQIIGDTTYREASWWNRDRIEHRTPTVMWNLLSIERGDLIIAVEGTNVRGICQAVQSGIDSYKYQQAYEYAHTVGFPVEWIDWDESLFGFIPSPPSRAPLGIVGLKKEHNEVLEAWRQYTGNNT